VTDDVVERQRAVAVRPPLGDLRDASEQRVGVDGRDARVVAGAFEGGGEDVGDPLRQVVDDARETLASRNAGQPRA
jgi:hypothetical protein